VRYDPRQSAFRFEFIDVDYPDEVTSQLVYDPGPKVERLVRDLNSLAEGTAGTRLPRPAPTWSMQA
jgi:hypothetical protein